jgi:hypothetical protein
MRAMPAERAPAAARGTGIATGPAVHQDLRMALAAICMLIVIFVFAAGGYIASR